MRNAIPQRMYGGDEWDSVMISEDELTFSSEAGSRTVSSQGIGFRLWDLFEYDGIYEELSRIPDPYSPQFHYSFIKGEWITVEISKRNGETPMEMTITVDKNDTGKERSGYVTLDGVDNPVSVIVDIVQLAE